jgi:hypothetical protein
MSDYEQGFEYGYHLGVADGEGSMENITPTSEKWRRIEQQGFERAASLVLALHRPDADICRECGHDWPCPTASWFLPDTTPEIDLREESV